ncbi:prolipoprotein diacylglyceryl transferase family protein [Tomitella biformata]|uniref:prolipoprotein diacylglyceryl transferase family protein n=1 Tax=Tomitella biformata TaxID=630403 RepID=UPI0027DE7631|nr:prolipoprotein diacylglyceryl transferase family protein [Tomitella biformata]
MHPAAGATAPAALLAAPRPLPNPLAHPLTAAQIGPSGRRNFAKPTRLDGSVARTPPMPQTTRSAVLQDVSAESAGKTPTGSEALVPDSEEGPGRCSDLYSQMEPQGLAVTYWGAAGEGPPPQDMSIRFVGTRHGASAPPDESDHFDRTLKVGSLPSHSGRFAVTARVKGISGGQWTVAASLLDGGTPLEEPQTAAAFTRPWAFNHGPGLRLWCWPLLVAAGAVFAVLLQGILLASTPISSVPVVGMSVLGCLLGYIGAKAWYLVLHREPMRNFARAGACIQGFLLVAFATLAVGTLLAGMDLGTVLDATTPGLFFGMAIGRPGCFLSGCCSGRPTSSRWGLWSSDRTLAVKRIPVQLFEAAAALLIAITTLALWFGGGQPFAGALFIGGVAAYTLVRQGLFLFRADSHTLIGRLAVTAACVLVLGSELTMALV